jgi:predicted aspartyl protease
LANKKPSPGFSFTATYNSIARSLPTTVKIESATNPDKFTDAKALWDTGASSSLISHEIAVKLDLKPISKTLIHTPSDKNVPSNVYLIHIYLPNGAKIVDVRALEGTLNSCDMLIGMDVISLGDFTVTNHNMRTIFSFRIPSMTEIDFCKHSYIQPIRNENRNIGRNEKCP